MANKQKGTLGAQPRIIEAYVQICFINLSKIEIFSKMTSNRIYKNISTVLMEYGCKQTDKNRIIRPSWRRGLLEPLCLNRVNYILDFWMPAWKSDLNRNLQFKNILSWSKKLLTLIQKWRLITLNSYSGKSRDFYLVDQLIWAISDPFLGRLSKYVQNTSRMSHFPNKWKITKMCVKS